MVLLNTLRNINDTLRLKSHYHLTKKEDIQNQKCPNMLFLLSFLAVESFVIFLRSMSSVILLLECRIMPELNRRGSIFKCIQVFIHRIRENERTAVAVVAGFTNSSLQIVTTLGIPSKKVWGGIPPPSPPCSAVPVSLSTVLERFV